MTRTFKASVGRPSTGSASFVALSALWSLWGCATGEPALPPPPLHGNGQALWRIVQGQCMPDQRVNHLPAPCADVRLAADDGHGFVVLKDRVGVAQHLLMPTALISGIEDAKILAPDAQNYFAEAWDARRFVQARLEQPLPRDWTSIAVNSIYGRSQDLLHLHIDCVDPQVRTALQSDAGAITEQWSRPIFRLKDRLYRLRWLSGETLRANPFKLLAEDVPGASQNMGAWTLAVIGAAPLGRGPGFYLVAARADPARGEPGSSEDLQDHSCTGLSRS